jgi:hypothetical protein
MNPHTGTHKAGNHAFRRFRNTYLRNYTECPEGLYKYAGRDMSDLYDKVKEDVEFRRKCRTVRIWIRVALSCTECTENCPKIGIGKSSVND